MSDGTKVVQITIVAIHVITSLKHVLFHNIKRTQVTDSKLSLQLYKEYLKYKVNIMGSV